MENEKKTEECPVHESSAIDEASAPAGESLPAEEQTEPAASAEEALAGETRESQEDVTGEADGREDPSIEKTLAAESTEAPAVEWRFGEGAVEEKSKKGSGQKQFFILFGVVFGICLLLLILTMFLGNGGIQLVRNITKERIVYVRNDDGSSGLLTPQEAADKIKRSTVTVSVTTAAGSGIGSGFVYSADGYICTNNHVVQDAVSVQVILPDGKAVDALVKGYDEAADIAVLKIEAEGLVPVEFGSSEDLLVGDEVVAVGTPAKLDYAGTATFGTVSATNRLVIMSDSSTGSVSKKMTLIQTDTSVNPGNSGGPLADMYGKVVGVVVMKVSTYGGSDYEGIGFALPIDGVRQIADAIISKGAFSGRNPYVEGRSLLGLTGHGGVEGRWYYVDSSSGAVTESKTEQSGYHQMIASGIYVMEINGANAQGKVSVGDVITQVNGLNVTSTTELIGAVNRYYAGETVTLTVRRGAETLYVEIMLYEETAS